SSEYVLAGADATVSSPLVGGVATEVDDAVGEVGTIVDTVLGTEGTTGSIIDELQGLSVDLDIAGFSLLSLGVEEAEVGVNGLDDALTELSNTLVNEPLVDENGVVSIDLASGVIDVDLEEAYVQSHQDVDSLNDLEANTRLLDNDTITGITTA